MSEISNTNVTGGIDRSYADFAVKKTCELLKIDSPTGFTDSAAEWVKNEFEALGFEAKKNSKGRRAHLPWRQNRQRRIAA